MWSSLGWVEHTSTTRHTKGMQKTLFLGSPMRSRSKWKVCCTSTIDWHQACANMRMKRTYTDIHTLTQTWILCPPIWAFTRRGTKKSGQSNLLWQRKDNQNLLAKLPKLFIWEYSHHLINFSYLYMTFKRIHFAHILHTRENNGETLKHINSSKVQRYQGPNDQNIFEGYFN